MHSPVENIPKTSLRISRLHPNPLIFSVESLAGLDECARLVELARENLTPAKVSMESGRSTSPGRFAESVWFKHDEDETLNRLAVRISEAAGQPLEQAESMQIVRYGVNGLYRPHFDGYNLATPKGKTYTAVRGQRLLTALLYLNTVESGGETFFPRLDLAVPAVRGNLLCFSNCIEGSAEVHPLSLHESKKVTAGEKWVAVLWFRERTRSGQMPQLKETSRQSRTTD